jgi:hypothetical protein
MTMSVPVRLTPATERIAVGHPRAQPVTLEDLEKAKAEQALKAKYKIELHFGKNRSTSGMKPTAGALLIWESGRRLHGGGDEKMYWCGYPDCGKPMSTDNFAYMHAICPKCKREMFLDPEARQKHIDSLVAENRRSDGLESLPSVVGERFFKLAPTRIADLLVSTFNDLDRNADVYLKYHPLDMRYDPKHETSKDLDNLDLARLRREPLIYTLKRIIADTSAGADLHARFLAMITA